MKILITGGSRGIGRACVERFAAEGHEVVFLYRSHDADAQEVSILTGAKAIKCDISSAAEVVEAVKTVGDVDVLVNNAGICDFSFFDAISDEQWRKMIDVNLSGAFYVSREISKAMIKNKYGRIINIGSVWGRTGAACEVHYSAAKAGLRGMTLALAKELGPSNITVNCIEPGVIDTDMNSALSDNDLRTLAEETPLGRIGSPNEVAELTCFLASDRASFITGQIIGIDGGFAI